VSDSFFFGNSRKAYFSQAADAAKLNYFSNSDWITEILHSWLIQKRISTVDGKWISNKGVNVEGQRGETISPVSLILSAFSWRKPGIFARLLFCSIQKYELGSPSSPDVSKQ